MKHKFLCLKVMCSMWYDIGDLTIPLLLLPHRMCFWQGWWPHLSAVMTRPCNSWLMDTSLCPAELITAENAQQAPALFPCVNFVISACLTIPDQYSIKGVFHLQLICCSSVRKPRNRDYLASTKNKTWLQQKMRAEGRAGVVRGDSQWSCTVRLHSNTVGRSMLRKLEKVIWNK